MSDWADEKAREWLITQDFGLDPSGYLDPVWLDTTTSGTACLSSLTALLREVKAGYANAEMGAAELQAMERDRTLAEVRRVIREVDKTHDGADSWCYVRDEILARLEKLTELRCPHGKLSWECDCDGDGG